MVKSYDDNYYICRTCDKTLPKKSVPCQAVTNRLNVAKLPKLFQDIRRLVCNISVSEVDVSCNMLTRPADSCGFIIVKLKRKLEYKGHVVFEAVRPDVMIQFPEFLRSHNDLYSGIEINPANIPVGVTF